MDFCAAYGGILMASFLDESVFNAATNLHCGLHFCLDLWDGLVARNESPRVLTPENLRAEVQAVRDTLSDCATAPGDRFFLPPVTI